MTNSAAAAMPQAAQVPAGTAVRRRTKISSALKIGLIPAIGPMMLKSPSRRVRNHLEQMRSDALRHKMFH